MCDSFSFAGNRKWKNKNFSSDDFCLLSCYLVVDFLVSGFCTQDAAETPTTTVYFFDLVTLLLEKEISMVPLNSKA